jgi:hypothetical protein
MRRPRPPMDGRRRAGNRQPATGGNTSLPLRTSPTRDTRENESRSRRRMNQKISVTRNYPGHPLHAGGAQKPPHTSHHTSHLPRRWYVESVVAGWLVLPKATPHDDPLGQEGELGSSASGRSVQTSEQLVLERQTQARPNIPPWHMYLYLAAQENKGWMELCQGDRGSCPSSHAVSLQTCKSRVSSPGSVPALSLLHSMASSLVLPAVRSLLLP